MTEQSHTTTLQIQAIETRYKGYRFRSRLEARWAVFLDLLHIEWQYEKEGFLLDGVGYLPDFYLPQLRVWLEIKGQEPDTAEQQKLYGLARGQDQSVYVAIGDPAECDVRQVRLANSDWLPDRLETGHGWVRCPKCATVSIAPQSKYWHSTNNLAAHLPCSCMDHGSWSETGWTLRTAQQTARAVRFEHGETPPVKLSSMPIPRISVYLAGKIPDDWNCDSQPRRPDDDMAIECACPPENKPRCVAFNWRTRLFPNLDLGQNYDLIGQQLLPQVIFAGPNLAMGHGQLGHGDIVEDCLSLLDRANVLFAWINRTDMHGTLVEVGYARARGIPIYVGCDSRHPDDLVRQNWFARSVANGWAVVPDVRLAWMLFIEWWAARTMATSRGG